MERNIVYDGEGRPHFESNFDFFLNFALRFLHKAVKRVASFAQRIFLSGIDGKKIIKKEPDVESPERRCKK